jgi:hypothetical protein
LSREDDAIYDGPHRKVWRSWRWLSRRKNRSMCGGNNKIGADVILSADVILNMGNRRLDRVDDKGSAVVVMSKQDGRCMGWRGRCGIICDMWSMVRPNASRGTVS